MRKIYLLAVSLVCLRSLSVYAASPCDSEQAQKKYPPCAKTNQQMQCQKPCQKQEQQCQKPCNPCPSPCENSYKSDCFLCTCKNMVALFQAVGLSETQICTAMKIQDKYELEVLSLKERIQCEKQNLCRLQEKCAKGSEIRKQKRLIKRLEKDVKKICKTYECQFKNILSDPQKKAYRKAKK